jgi:predicted MFS family arabinose efflux permease
LLGSTLGGWVAGSLGGRLGFSKALGLLAPLAVLALAAAAAQRLWLFPLMLAAPFAWNVLYPLLSDYLSRRVPDDERATTLSISQAVVQVGGIVATLALGLAVDRGGTQTALAAAAGCLLGLIGLAYWRWWRASDLEIEPTGGARYDPTPLHEVEHESR